MPVHNRSAGGRAAPGRLTRAVVGRLVVAGLIALLAGFIAVSPAAAAESCHTINAKGTGQATSETTTVAQIRGGGLLQGTTAASFETITPIDTGVAFTGPIVFTTNRATLTVQLAGTLDIPSGAFRATGQVTGATGKLAGATGQLDFDGVQNLVDGSFTETVAGEICVDLAP